MKASTKKSARTAADVAYDCICDKILKGELPPGTKLSRRKMAELTGVSMIPVIEALHRLEEEGLVESYPYFGSQVIELNQENIEDRYALREAVECQVARILAIHITDEQRNRLEFLADQLDETSREDHDLFWDRHYELHLAMASMTGKQSLEKALHRINLFNLLQRSVETKVVSHDAIPADLHRQIVNGITTGDPDSAEKAMREHIYFSGLIRQ